MMLKFLNLNIFYLLPFTFISPREILNLKISLSRLEKYHIPLVAEGESISSMTKTAKIFLIS